MDENTRINGPLSAGAVLRASGYDYLKDPGHWSEWTHVVTCKMCKNQFTTRDWIRGRRTFTATICQPCSDLPYSRPNPNAPASTPAPETKVNLPYKED
jgi:hypothetical protein